MQYPEWFTAKTDNRTELATVRERWPGLPVCVEFRSPTWLATPGTAIARWAPSRDLGLALVVVDAPAVSKLPIVLEVTSPDLAVVRFHGRNDDTWKKPNTTAAERFQYLYSKPQLRAWVPRLRRSGRSGHRGARPDEQLLPGLRRPQRRRPGHPPQRRVSRFLSWGGAGRAGLIGTGTGGAAVVIDSGYFRS